MMNFKHTSQLAMLSVLLTFTHAIGQTAGAQGAVPSEVVFQDEEFVLESQKVKRQQRLARYQEQKLKKQQEAKDRANNVAPKQAAKAITFKGIRSNKQEDLKLSKQSEQQVPVADQQNKEAVIQENVQGKLSTVIKPVAHPQNQSSSRWSLLGFLRRTPKQSNMVAKGVDVNNTVHQVEQAAAVRVVNRIDINQYGGESEKPITLSTVMISKDAQEAILSGEKVAAAALTQGLSVPVAGYDQVIAQAETESLVQKQVRDSKSFRISNLKDSLTLNKEKIARVKAERNAKRKSSSRDQVVKKKDPAEAKKVVNHEAASQDSYKQAQAEGNSNVDAYVQATQYQCDANATDWPCDECVVKRRANVGISICTMIVTVLALIVGAIIISNASDTPDKGTAKP